MRNKTIAKECSDQIWYNELGHPIDTVTGTSLLKPEKNELKLDITSTSTRFGQLVIERAQETVPSSSNTHS